MKVVIKKILSLTVLVIVLFGLVCNSVSCSNKNRKTLSVRSASYPSLTELTSGEPDTRKHIWWNVDSNPYMYNECYVSVENGGLIVSNYDPWSSASSQIAEVAGGIFIGTRKNYDYGFCKHYSGLDTEGMLILDKACIGFIVKTERHVYVITSEQTDGPRFSDIYELKWHGIDQWECEMALHLENYVRCYYYSEMDNVLYAVTSDSIFKITLDNKEAVPLFQNDYWKHIYHNSIVELNGRLYVGSNCGVHEYVLETGELTWFPMDYEKHVTSDGK